MQFLLSTLTQSAQESNQAPLMLKLINHPTDTSFQLYVAEVLEELGEILLKYKLISNDPLSVKIQDWGKKVLLYDFKEEYESLDLMKRIAEIRLSELIQTILVDHILKTPLYDPVLLETEWTCEKLYVDSSHLATIPYKTHALAKEILNWVQPLIAKPNVEENAIEVSHFKSSPQGRVIIDIYNLSADLLLSAHNLAVVTKQVSMAQDRSLIVSKRVKEETEAKLEEAHQMVKETRQQLMTRIEDSEATQMAEVNTLNQIVEGLKIDVTCVKDDLKEAKVLLAKSESKNKENEEKIGGLNKSLDEVRRQKQNKNCVIQ